MIKKKEIVIGVPLPWGRLQLSQQNTSLGDYILSHQFDSIVKVKEGGGIVPSIAIKYEFDENLTELTFEIDSKKRFSDGTRVTAYDVKRSWEVSLDNCALDEQSTVCEFFYKVIGHSEFHKTKSLSGIEVVNEKILKVKFNSSFRLGLEFLAGTRFGVYKEHDGKVIGTGPYLISQNTENNVELIKTLNASSDSFDKITIRLIKEKDILNEYKKENLDGFIMSGGIPKEICEDSNIKCYSGFHSNHVMFLMNGNNTGILSDKENRKTMSYLLWLAHNTETVDYPRNVKNIQIDFQPYLPFQTGRLAESEVEEHFKSLNDLKNIDKLARESRLNPIKFLTPLKRSLSVIEFLKSKGVVFTESSNNEVPFTELLKSRVEGNYDMMAIGISVLDTDPDGLYHFVGKHGAIADKGSYRPEVDKLMEEGRQLLDLKKIDSHYQQVTRVILDEVPFFHSGFLGLESFFRIDVIELENKIISRRPPRLYELKMK